MFISLHNGGRILGMTSGEEPYTCQQHEEGREGGGGVMLVVIIIMVEEEEECHYLRIE